MERLSDLECYALRLELRLDREIAQVQELQERLDLVWVAFLLGLLGFLVSLDPSFHNTDVPRFAQEFCLITWATWVCSVVAGRLIARRLDALDLRKVLLITIAQQSIDESDPVENDLYGERAVQRTLRWLVNRGLIASDGGPIPLWVVTEVGARAARRFAPDRFGAPGWSEATAT